MIILIKKNKKNEKNRGWVIFLKKKILLFEKSFKEKQLDTSTIDAMFSGQRFAVSDYTQQNHDQATLGIFKFTFKAILLGTLQKAQGKYLFVNLGKVKQQL